jgi:hypothetical protein
MNIDDNLSNIFDVAPIPDSTVVTQPTANVAPLPESDQVKIESDYSVTRANLLSILSVGSEALRDALEIAKESEHPRAFEVVGNLMKQVADINQQLMDLHQQKFKLDSSRSIASPQNQTNTTNNAIFVGSTSELSKALKAIKTINQE